MDKIRLYFISNPHLSSLPILQEKRHGTALMLQKLIIFGCFYAKNIKNSVLDRKSFIR